MKTFYGTTKCRSTYLTTVTTREEEITNELKYMVKGRVVPVLN
jgi:hypothetical protein